MTWAREDQKMPLCELRTFGMTHKNLKEIYAIHFSSTKIPANQLSLICWYLVTERFYMERNT